MTETKITWTNRTWNPTVGCSKTSHGCDNCYAISSAISVARKGGKAAAAYTPALTTPDGTDWTGEVRCLPARLGQPRTWTKPRLVFVNSMSDLFHPSVPDNFILQVWETMRQSPQHQFQILTKRPKRMADLIGRLAWRQPTSKERNTGRPQGPVAYLFDGTPTDNQAQCGGPLILPNVWLGVSIESQRYAFRTEYLNRTPAAVKWVSAEPLLGPLNLNLTGIGWLVIGCESGTNARPMNLQWVRDLRDQTKPTTTALFIKQLPSGKHRPLTNPELFPSDLRIQSWPTPLEISPQTPVATQ